MGLWVTDCINRDLTYQKYIFFVCVGGLYFYFNETVEFYFRVEWCEPMIFESEATSVA